MGGHVLTTKHREVLKLVESETSLYYQTRRAFVLKNRQLIPYPFQDNYPLLDDPTIVAQCHAAQKKGSYGDPANFEEFLKDKLGYGVFEHFAQPYNEKLWGAPLSRLSPEWGAERVVTSAMAATEGELDRLPLTSDCTIAYPSTGGFSTIFERFAAKLGNQIRCNSEVTFVDLEKRLVRTTNGETYHYDNLITSLPLDTFLRLCGSSVPAEASDTKHLEAIGLKLVLMRCEGQLPLERHRIYSADRSIPFHKLVFQNTSSPFQAALPCHGLIAEISGSSFGRESHRTLVQKTIDALTSNGIIPSARTIREARVISVPRAYPAQLLGKQLWLMKLKSALLRNRAHLLGRFAEWDYINSDQVIKRAISLAILLNGMTYTEAKQTRAA